MRRFGCILIIEEDECNTVNGVCGDTFFFVGDFAILKVKVLVKGGVTANIAVAMVMTDYL